MGGEEPHIQNSPSPNLKQQNSSSGSSGLKIDAAFDRHRAPRPWIAGRGAGAASREHSGEGGGACAKKLSIFGFKPSPKGIKLIFQPADPPGANVDLI